MQARRSTWMRCKLELPAAQSKCTAVRVACGALASEIAMKC